MNISLIITNDYEILGDGGGNPQEMLCAPTEEILTICEEFEAPHTLFAEVLEIGHFLNAERNGFFTSYAAGSLIEEQLCRAVAAGHDVQLHLHPQWIGAKAVAPDQWEVTPDFWRLPKVPGGLDSPDNPTSLRGLFRNGKRQLEALLQPVRPDYRCIAFRAGGYCIQPSAAPIAAMREEGFCVDSSVSPGRYVDKGHAFYDFRNAPTREPFWPISDDVNTPDVSGKILEIPVHTFSRAPILLRQPKAPTPASHFLQRRNTRQNRRTRRSGILTRLARQLWPKAYNLDFCRLNSSDMVRAVKGARKRFAPLYPKGSAPVVMTGHSKEWPGGEEFRRFLDWASRQPWIELSTFPHWLKQMEGTPCK